MIRFQRIGRTNDPAFRIVLLEKERAAKAGGITELLGTYNPKSKALTLKEDRVKYWLSVGAQATGSIHNLLISKGVIEGKKRNVLPRKTVAKAPEAPTSKVGVPTEETEASGKTDEVAPEASAETPAAEDAAAPETPTEAEIEAEAVPAEPEAAAPSGMPAPTSEVGEPTTSVGSEAEKEKTPAA